MRPQTPFVPGTDAAGIVSAVGAGVTRFKPGDRVACGGWVGSFAEQLTAPQSWAARLPPAVDYITGSAVRHCYGTAYYGLVICAKLQPGETVFVTGAAGGVGLAVVDLARHLGARVIAGVGSAEKAAIVREYGAAEVIDYAHEDLRERIKACHRRQRRRRLLRYSRRRSIHHHDAADELGRPHAADRLRERSDSVGADESSLVEKLFDRRRLLGRLGRALSASQRRGRRASCSNGWPKASSSRTWERYSRWSNSRQPWNWCRSARLKGVSCFKSGNLQS